MNEIVLHTHIHASVEKVFNLSRDIDFHMSAAKHTQEKAIAGRTSGLIKLHETITWRGKHFGFYLTHESIISTFKFPEKFTDETNINKI
ncbi:hypothetical protein J8281_02175 [Aquimarina sp. U1-2]|uniref:hypothetical protein n=1 Tax=Aquimarina sp. U1-2 TaxID=2823141 RepID=UPI001AEC7842|nr:hypothetical protein [Aquimarina sp. U1-2]MBP2830981.1 hypothetical protein [Aquimarina sp. U1-2]